MKKELKLERGWKEKRDETKKVKMRKKTNMEKMSKKRHDIERCEEKTITVSKYSKENNQKRVF